MARSMSIGDTGTTRPRSASERHPTQWLALAVGLAFTGAGIAGFFVTGFDEFAGRDTDETLLGFEINPLHNIVHILFGVAGLAMAKNYKSATTYLIGGGVIYLLLTVYGWLIDQDSAANFVPLNNADNWLHLALGIGMIALGMIGSRAAKGDRAGAAAPR